MGFLANSAVRVHPNAWASGVGVGAAAVIYLDNNFNDTK